MLDSLPMLDILFKRIFALLFGVVVLTSCVAPNECNDDSACSERSPETEDAIQIPARLIPINRSDEEVNLLATLVGERLTLQSNDDDDDDFFFKMTIENAAEEQFFDNFQGNAGVPPVDFAMTSSGESWNTEDLLFYSWEQLGEQHYQGGLVWEAGNLHDLIIGELVTRTYQCIFDEFLCTETKVTMFYHQNIAPSDCTGEEDVYVLGTCSEAAVGVCSFEDFVQYFMPEICNYPNYIENYAADCYYQELNGGCDAQN